MKSVFNLVVCINLTKQNDKDLDYSLNGEYKIFFTGKFPQKDMDNYQFLVQISSSMANVITPSILVD